MESQRVGLSLHKMELYGIHIIDEREFNKYKDPLLKLLPKQQQERIMLFKKPDDLQRSLLGEAMCRAILAKVLDQVPSTIELVKSEKGKPYLKDHNNIHFNLSHSGNWVVMVLHDKPVGVDVENVREVDYRIAQRFFSKEEYAELDLLEGLAKRRLFFRLWTLKESYLKFLGKGLTKSLGSFTVFEEKNRYWIKHGNLIDHQVYFNCYEPDQIHMVAVCAEDRVFPERIQKVEIKELINTISR